MNNSLNLFTALKPIRSGLPAYRSNSWLYTLFIVGLFGILANSCKDEKNNNPVIPPTLPVITTNAVTNISYNIARCGGKITSDGGAYITARGVCYDTIQEPVISGPKTINGSDTGSFISFLTSLKANTKYYARAFATNSAGTAYGNAVSFNTTGYFIQGGGVTDIDGNKYSSIILGSQEWMVENLKVARYQNGDTIPNITDNTEWLNLMDGACCEYENKPVNTITYGKLYNFYAVDDSRYICPAGWHVPTHDEWNTLITYLEGETVAGGKLKQSGTIHWLSPNTGATNESGFTALPGGLRSGFNGIYNYQGEEGDWWSSTEDDDANAWEAYLLFNDNSVATHYYDKNLGLSVRCIKNK